MRKTIKYVVVYILGLLTFFIVYHFFYDFNCFEKENKGGVKLSYSNHDIISAAMRNRLILNKPILKDDLDSILNNMSQEFSGFIDTFIVFKYSPDNLCLWLIPTEKAGIYELKNGEINKYVLNGVGS